ncbi:hypothetical protein H4S14_003763 [Agrobacterium vitis]|nr:hypothetical protein [Agrobacterium vitis]MBE1439994.1 hypothetical protein [Agrobacterium vitis]
MQRKADFGNGVLMIARLFFAALTALAAYVGAAKAADRYRTEYRVTLIGLPVARATFTTRITDPGYTITGNITSAGIVNIFTSMDAKSTVTGTMLSGDRMQPQTYKLVYTRGKRTRTYDVRYASGNIVETTITPQPNRDSNRWIPVKSADLKSVLDPIGALIIPDDGKICSRTLPVYDGESRMDLVLAPKGTAKFDAGNVSGEAIVCSVRYRPKSGYNKDQSDIDYLRNATSMEIWFAKTRTGSLYAPVYARVPTRIGTLSITATAFGKD